MIRRFASSFAFVALLGACAVASDGAQSNVAAATASTGSSGSTDPMDHLNVLAAADMEGRGTGTPGFQRAADYVAAECVKAGLVGAFPATATPYFQPFTVGGLAPHVAAPGPVTPLAPDANHDDDDFGNDLFEEGIYLTGDASAETLREMSERVCGDHCPAGVDPRDLVKTVATTSANNVVGYFPGTGAHRNEIILFSAHLDHLGKTSSGLFPGADDNASGSAVMLSLMHSIASAQLDRTVAFLWTAGEEKGLLGSAYFVDNSPPTVPVAKIKQLVNMDMVGYWDDTRFSVGTDGSAASTQALAQIQAANRTLPVPFAKMNQDIQQYKSRQDGYSFSRRNIPAVFVFEGLSNPAGGGSLMANYHRTTDTLANFLADNNGTKIRKMALLLSAIATTLANAP